MSDSPPTDNPEPPAKRAHLNAEETIQNNDIPMDMNKEIKLDRLHMYHLRHILDYLSIHDIMGSMTVSKQWQANILEYLLSSRFCFEYYHLPRTHYVPRLLGLVDDVRHKRALPFDMSHGGFQVKVQELGPAIVSIVLDYFDETNLKIITQNCPNLQNLMLVGLKVPQGPPGQLPADQQCELLTFTEEARQCLQQLQLKRVSFVHSPDITEEYIREFLKCESVEEILICRNRSVEGRCLSLLKSKLKCLRLIACSLNFINLNAIADRLTALTILDLSNNPSEILLSVHHLLDKTANLECLFLNSYEHTNVGNDFVESLRRLGRLKHLSLCWNDNVSDVWLEAVALGCNKLETVDIESKRRHETVSMLDADAGRAVRCQVVTANGVQTLCRGTPKLVHLGLAGHGTMDDTQLAACVSVCPDLESLDLRGCALVAGPLVAVAAAREGAAAAAGRAPRPLKPLRLRLARSAVNRYSQPEMQVTEALIYDFLDAPRIFRLV